jgi:hypothetical protein
LKFLISDFGKQQKQQKQDQSGESAIVCGTTTYHSFGMRRHYAFVIRSGQGLARTPSIRKAGEAEAQTGTAFAAGMRVTLLHAHR